MNICDAHNDTVVVWHGRGKCDLCDALERLEDSEKEHAAEVAKLEEAVNDAEAQLEAYKTDLRSYAELVQEVSPKEGVVE